MNNNYNNNDDNKKHMPIYSDYIEFFNNYVRFIYTRKIDRTNTCWDEYWINNFEAVERISALHIAFEDAYTNNKLAEFFLQIFDPMMNVLFSNTGPFRTSKYEKKSGLPLPEIIIPTNYID
jgi:hypothetical protein